MHDYHALIVAHAVPPKVCVRRLTSARRRCEVAMRGSGDACRAIAEINDAEPSAAQQAARADVR